MKSVFLVELWLPLIVTVCFAALAFFLLGFVIRNFHKVGFVVTVFFILFFSYGHAHSLLEGMRILGVEVSRHRHLMMIWGLLFLIFSISILFIRSKNLLSKLSTYFNFFGFVLMILLFLQVGMAYAKNIFLKEKSFYLEKASEVEAKKPVSSMLSNAQPLPDIYYIILDSYLSYDVLKEISSFDNSEFYDYLGSKGFFIATKSRSNYVWTEFSLPSSLNFRYLKKDEDTRRLRFNNKVSEILKSKGYKIVSVSFVSEGDFFCGIKADKQYSYGPCRSFLSKLLDTTWAYPLTVFGFLNSIYDYQRRCTLYQFEKLNEIPQMKEPTFTFAHIFLPHPPYIFDREGKPFKFKLSSIFKLKNARGNLWRQQEILLYMEQLTFANKKIQALIDNILSSNKGSVEPIIILQADHGPFLGLSDNNLFEELLQQRTSILNAYHLSENAKKYLYESISPVNSFRVVFNVCFGSDYELLPDECYFSKITSTSDFIKLD